MPVLSLTSEPPALPPGPKILFSGVSGVAGASADAPLSLLLLLPPPLDDDELSSPPQAARPPTARAAATAAAAQRARGPRGARPAVAGPSSTSTTCRFIAPPPEAPRASPVG